jgi:hypothetical protein
MAKSEIVYKCLIACVSHSVIKIGEQGQCNITMLTFENLICMGIAGRAGEVVGGVTHHNLKNSFLKEFIKYQSKVSINGNILCPNL